MVLAGAGAMWMAGRPARGHDVITSTVTFNRDLLPIFRARCLSCHREGGRAFSLQTYADARPWAKAIEEEVLRRRMPPWGAVPGYGAFRNDPSLTMTEMQKIAEWAEGGAPEGDAVQENGAQAAGQDSISLTGAKTSEKPASAALQLPGAKPLQEDMLLDRIEVAGAQERSSFRLVAELPDGAQIPLLWMGSFSPTSDHPFLFQRPVVLPAGTVIRGLPDGATLKLYRAEVARGR